MGLLHRRGFWFGLAAVTATAFIVASCEEITARNDNGEGVLRNLGEKVILPTYRDLAASAQELHDAATTFADDPTEAHLKAAQGAWRRTREPWGELHAFTLGPYIDLRVGAVMDQWPPATTRIEGVLAGEEDLTMKYITSLGANERGFFSIEYLLWGDGDSDAVLAAFTGSEPGARRRGEYLKMITQELADKTAGLQEAWEPDGGNFLPKFTMPGTDGALYNTVKEQLDALVNEVVFASEDVSLITLGDPLGKNHGGVLQPDLLRSARSDNTEADMRAYLQGVRNMYYGSRDGTRSLGLGVIVRERRPSTDVALEKSIQDAFDAVDALPKSLREAILDGDPKVDHAYAVTTALTRDLATDMIAAFGATLALSDNDGD